MRLEPGAGSRKVHPWELAGHWPQLLRLSQSHWPLHFDEPVLHPRIRIAAIGEQLNGMPIFCTHAKLKPSGG